MPPLDVTTFAFHAPLRVPVSHASHTRSTGASVVVRLARGGHEGIGEGCPRPYVTGETMDAALAWLAELRPELAGIASVDDLRAFADARRGAIDRTPGAWCAAETALLDLLAREAGTTVEGLLGLPGATGPFAMTAVLFDAPLPVLDALVARHASVGFRDWKLRLSGSLDEDRQRLALVRKAGAARIRVDANNRWRDRPDEALPHLRALLADGPIAAVEEPVSPGDVATLSRLSTALDLPVVLDESACTDADLERLDGLPGRFVVNVKVSKAGGLLRALRLVDAAHGRGLPVTVGAQVGETSILTRLATVVARAVPGGPWGHEGAYGTLLLAEEPVRPELRFGAGGILDPDGAGWGPTGLGLSWIGGSA